MPVQCLYTACVSEVKRMCAWVRWKRKTTGSCRTDGWMAGQQTFNSVAQTGEGCWDRGGPRVLLSMGQRIKSHCDKWWKRPWLMRLLQWKRSEFQTSVWKEFWVVGRSSVPAAVWRSSNNTSLRPGCQNSNKRVKLSSWGPREPQETRCVMYAQQVGTRFVSQDVH